MTDAPIQVRKASRKKAKLRLGLSAPSGAGKTLGALLLAYGVICDSKPKAIDPESWARIGLIDTEEGSGELYVGVHKHGITIGEYSYIRLSAPFSALKYLEAIRAMEAAGIEVIITDSLTHAWAGTGGLLEKQGRITDNDPKKNSYTAWRHVTPDHNALVDAMLQSPAHIIGTMRSKVEYAMQQGANGKQQIVKLGLAPVQREGMEYEFTVFFDINDQSIAHATKDRTDLFSTVNVSGFLEKREFMITPLIGQEIASWLNKGIEAPIIVSLDSLCESISREVMECNDINILTSIYASHEQDFQRIEREKNEWITPMMALFEARATQLQDTAHAV